MKLVLITFILILSASAAYAMDVKCSAIQYIGKNEEKFVLHKQDRNSLILFEGKTQFYKFKVVYDKGTDFLGYSSITDLQGDGSVEMNYQYLHPDSPQGAIVILKSTSGRAAIRCQENKENK